MRVFIFRYCAASAAVNHSLGVANGLLAREFELAVLGADCCEEVFGLRVSPAGRLTMFTLYAEFKNIGFSNLRRVLSRSSIVDQKIGDPRPEPSKSPQQRSFERRAAPMPPGDLTRIRLNFIRPRLRSAKGGRLT